MMKTKFFYVAALILGLAFTTTSCSSDDDNPTVDPANIDYTPENASSWHNYMRNVAALLKTDATNLYNAWNSSYKGGESYASLFKAHSGSPYASALSCVVLPKLVTHTTCIKPEILKKHYMLWNPGTAGILVMTIPITFIPSGMHITVL